MTIGTRQNPVNPLYPCLLFFGAAGEALVLQLGVAEVHQQSHFKTGGFQIVDYLSLMLRGDSLRRLELNQNFILNQQIREESPNRLAPECYFDGILEKRR